MKHLLTALLVTGLTSTVATAESNRYGIIKASEKMRAYWLTARYLWNEPVGYAPNQKSFQFDDVSAEGCLAGLEDVRAEFALSDGDVLTHADLEGAPGARTNGDGTYSVPFSARKEICAQYGREATMDAFRARLIKFVENFNQRIDTLKSYSAEARVNLMPSAEECDAIVDEFAAKSIDDRSMNVDDSTFTAKTAKQKFCSQAKKYAADFDQKTRAAKDAFEAEQERLNKAREAREAAERQAVLSTYKKYGIAGDKLDHLDNYAPVGAGGQDLTMAQAAKAGVLFVAMSSNTHIEVTKYRFKGNKLVGTSTMSFSRLLYTVNDSRLYR